MSTIAQVTETTVTLRLTERARAKLAEQAASSGQDISAVASDLIEQAVTQPSLAEIMAPVRQQVADSGMTDHELDDFLRGELDDYRREKESETYVTAPLVVYDTMVFLQAAIHPDRRRTSIESVEDGRLKLCTSPALMAEVRDVLTRPHLVAKFPALTP